MRVTIELDTHSSADMEVFRAVFGVGPAFDPAADVAEPVEPEKPKRKRRTKAEIEADKKAAKAHPDDEPKVDPTPSDPFSNGYDFAAAKADLEKIRDHDDHGLPAVIEILKVAGVDKVNALDGNEKGLAAVRAEVEKRLG